MPRTLDEGTIRDLRAILDSEGYFFLAGLPSDFDHMDLLGNLGAIMPQYNDEEQWIVRPGTEFEDKYHSLNRSTLFPHTECYEFERLPPRFQAFWCIRPARDHGGLTTLMDGYRFLETMSSDDAPHLSKIRQFVSSSGIKAMPGHARTATHPICEMGPRERRILRISVNCMIREDNDVWAGEFFRRLMLFFQEHHIRISWVPGALLVLDNWRFVHSRTHFDDWGRELRRVWISSD